MSPGDPINAASSVLWHPTASAPDGGTFDPASTIMTYNTLGYWQPYRDMHDAVGKGDVDSAAATLRAYVEAAAARPPFLTNILVLYGDDAPMELRESLRMHTGLRLTRCCCVSQAWRCGRPARASWCTNPIPYLRFLPRRTTAARWRAARAARG